MLMSLKEFLLFHNHPLLCIPELVISCRDPGKSFIVIGCYFVLHLKQPKLPLAKFGLWSQSP